MKQNSFEIRMSVQLFEQLETSTEKAVIMAILSFSNNGKGDCFAGQRQIAARAGCSKGTVTYVIAQLIKKGFLARIGKKKTIGGWTDVLSLSAQSVTAFEAKSGKENSSCLSGQPLTASGQKQAIKRSTTDRKVLKKDIYLKKRSRIKQKTSSITFLKTLSLDELERLSKDFPPLTVAKVREQRDRAVDWCRANGKKYRDYRAFFRNWLRNSAERLQPEKADLEAMGFRKGGGQ